MTSEERARIGLAAGFAAAAAVRLLLLFSYPGGYDTESYEIVAGIEARHENVYVETRRYNYSPVWAKLLAALAAAGRVSGLGLLRTVGLFLFAADAVTAWLVSRLSSSRGLAALLFFANPVSVLVSSWHLQFDGLSILFLLLAIHAYRSRGDGSRLSAIWLSVSLLAKHVTWFHPLLFARREGLRRAGWYAVPYAAFAASFLPYAAAWRQVRDHVFRYRSLSGNYGTEALLLIPAVPAWVPPALFAAAMAGAIWYFGRRGRAEEPDTSKGLARGSLGLFLVMLVFLPGFGRQYCVWPVALGSLFPGAGLLVFTAVSTGFLARGFFPFDGAPAWLPGWYGPWWAALLWLLLELRPARKAGRLA